MKAIILAGGSGTRLWPVSRKNKPKQLQSLLGKQTLLQQTFNRLKKIFGTKDIFISTNFEQVKIIKKQLAEFSGDNFILEPVSRGTAAAIGLAALKLYHQDPQSILITINSDHYIKDEKEYRRTLKTAEKIVKQYPRQTVLVGLPTFYPETGYGYIKRGKQVFKIGQNIVYGNNKFIEKPDIKTAKKYFVDKDYFWNPAIFCWRTDYLLDLFKKYLPDQYQIFKKIENFLGTPQENRVIQKEFLKIKPISIDYGIMEKTKDILMLVGRFGWLDIGDWRAVKKMFSAKENDNMIKGEHILLDSSGNLIYNEKSDKVTAVIGLKDMIVIDTKDVLLVCPQNRAQEVKKIVEEIKKRGLGKYL